MDCYKLDCMRRSDKMPLYQKYLRYYQKSNFCFFKYIYKFMFVFTRLLYHVEISASMDVGPGLYLVHPYCITINPNAKIGKNCNIHKGVTIGQENRGTRKGSPSIGDCVWIGVNSTIVGNVTIGNDVLIAPNTFVNRDVPSHSIVFGNPCVIKHCDNATQEYINNKI